MQWYIDCWKKWNVFTGRSRRSEYWYFVLINAVISMLLVFTLHMIGMIYGVVVLVPTIAVQIRRLHDIGRSGWWLWIYLLPVIGTIVLFVFFILDSDPGPNQYGPNPKGISASPVSVEPSAQT